MKILKIREVAEPLLLVLSPTPVAHYSITNSLALGSSSMFTAREEISQVTEIGTLPFGMAFASVWS